MSLVKPITKWAPVMGVWDISTKDPIYLRPQDNIEPQGHLCSLCVSDVWFQGGRVEATVTLARFNNGRVHPNTAGAILIGYKSVNHEYLAIGLGSYGAAYTLLRFAPETCSWVGLAVVGSLESLRPEQPYRLSAHIQGQSLTLEVDGVQVLAHQLETAVPKGRLGLYRWGPNKVEFQQASLIEEPGNVFVVMPFTDYYIKDLFEAVIRPIVEEGDNNLVAHHAGEILGPGIIIEDIHKHISASKIVIAEITEPNQNVWYEVGFAHALKIPTILLVQNDTKLPFDISAYRCIFYENSIGGRDKIVDRLRKNVREILGS
jgi:hypothetical protein